MNFLTPLEDISCFSSHSFSPDTVALACGAFSKGSLCITRGHEAILQRIGEPLDSIETCDHYEAAARKLMATLGVKPSIVAHDLHPDLFSTRFAERIAEEHGASLVAVQHHHAHAATIAAEHDLENAPFLCVVFDGFGIGTDGNSWGGELLLVDGGTFERIGRLYELAAPGGDAAAREPWRMAASALFQLGRSEEIVRRFPIPGAEIVREMLEHNVRSPLTSSAGRLFDAAAGLLGVSMRMESEADAAMKLQSMAEEYGPIDPMKDGWRIEQARLESDGALSLLPLLARLADEQAPSRGAALFHATLAAAVAEWSVTAANVRGLDRIAVSGGCFLNALLLTQLKAAISQRAPTFEILEPRRLPPDDSGISLGQAWIAHTQSCWRR